MNIRTSALALLIALFAALPAYGSNTNKKKQVQNSAVPRQQRQIRSASPQSSTQRRFVRGEQPISRHNGQPAARSHGVPFRDRNSSQLHANSVYHFHGTHRGGGRYVDGRLMGRFANDRVYVDRHWYVWQEVPVTIDGGEGYGWALADETVGPVAGEAEPLIIGSGPDYYIVEVDNVSSRVTRDEFYAKYPRYSRAHHLTGNSSTVISPQKAPHNRQSQKRSQHRRVQ